MFRLGPTCDRDLHLFSDLWHLLDSSFTAWVVFNHKFHCITGTFLTFNVIVNYNPLPSLRRLRCHLCAFPVLPGCPLQNCSPDLPTNQKPITVGSRNLEPVLQQALFYIRVQHRIVRFDARNLRSREGLVDRVNEEVTVDANLTIWIGHKEVSNPRAPRLCFLGCRWAGI